MNMGIIHWALLFLKCFKKREEKKKKKRGAIHCSILPSDFLLWSVAKNTAWSRSGSCATLPGWREQSGFCASALSPSTLMRACCCQLCYIRLVCVRACQLSSRMLPSLWATRVSKLYMQPDGLQGPRIFSRCHLRATSLQHSKLIMILLPVSVRSMRVPPRQAELIWFFCFSQLLILLSMKLQQYLHAQFLYSVLRGEDEWQWADWKTWALLFNFPLQFCFVPAAEEGESGGKPTT